MEYLLTALLIAAGLFLLLMEIFIPSWGLLSISGTACLVAGLVLAFRHGTATGILALCIVLVLLPTEIVIGVKLFPSTWMGRRIVLKGRERTGRGERSTDDRLFGLVGKEGYTTSTCRPSGVAEIAGERVDVVAEGRMIDANRPVKVLRVEGNRVVVREREA